MLLLSGLVMIATDSNGGAADVAAGITGVAGTVSTGITGIADVAAAVTTAAAALSFSTLAFSVPVAMHLSRYGRLPSWNKSRTQCLVIFHSTMKEILAIAICCNIPHILFKYALYVQDRLYKITYEIILKFEMILKRKFIKDKENTTYRCNQISPYK